MPCLSGTCRDVRFPTRFPVRERFCKVLCDHLEGWDREGGWNMQEGGDMEIYVYV